MVPLRFRLLAALAVALALASAGPVRAHGPASAKVAELTRAIAANPRDARLLLERAEYQRAEGHTAEALADLDRAGALDPRLARVGLVRGRVLLEAGDAAGAAGSLEGYVAAGGADGEGWSLLARARFALGRDDGALDAYDRAIAAAEAPAPDLYLERSRTLARLGTANRGRATLGLREGIARIGAAPALVEELARWEGGPPVLPDAAAPSEERPDVGGAPAPDGDVIATLTRGPYLQRATRNTITIRWRTDSLTDSRVRYGTTPDNLIGLVNGFTPTTEHSILISALPANSRWYYSVGSSTQTLAGDSTTFFWTLPDTTHLGPTRLWVLGDSGLPGAAQNAVRDAYVAWNGGRRTHLMLMLGDNAYSVGTDAEYQAGLFTPYAAQLRNHVLWPTRGNHDLIHAGVNNDYYDLFTLPTAGEAGGVISATEAYYSLDFGNLHLVCLDSEGSNLTTAGAMRAWLRTDLLANRRPWVIAFWHHPPYTKGSHNSDNPSDSGARMQNMRQNFVSLLDSLGVDLTLTGHSHSYERSILLRGHYGLSNTLIATMKVDSGDGRRGGDGPYQKLSPGPGPQEGAVHAVAGSSAQISGGTLNHPVMVSSLNALGSLAIEIEGNRLDARFISSTGAVLDSFAIEKGPTVAVGPGPGPALALSTARPNPAPGAVRLDYTLARAGSVRLAVVGVDGRRVATLASGPRGAGTHAAVWDGRDARGRLAPPGVYFAVLEQDGERRVRRFVRVQ